MWDNFHGWYTQSYTNGNIELGNTQYEMTTYNAYIHEPRSKNGQISNSVWEGYDFTCCLSKYLHE